MYISLKRVKLCPAVIVYKKYVNPEFLVSSVSYKQLKSQFKFLASTVNSEDQDFIQRGGVGTHGEAPPTPQLFQ